MSFGPSSLFPKIAVICLLGIFDIVFLFVPFYINASLLLFIVLFTYYIRVHTYVNCWCPYLCVCVCRVEYKGIASQAPTDSQN